MSFRSRLFEHARAIKSRFGRPLRRGRKLWQNLAERREKLFSWYIEQLEDRVLLSTVDPIISSLDTSLNTIVIDVTDDMGLVEAAAENTANYSLIASGGDGIFGNGNDVVVRAKRIFPVIPFHSRPAFQVRQAAWWPGQCVREQQRLDAAARSLAVLHENEFMAV